MLSSIVLVSALGAPHPVDEPAPTPARSARANDLAAVGDSFIALWRDGPSTKYMQRFDDEGRPLAALEMLRAEGTTWWDAECGAISAVGKTRWLVTHWSTEEVNHQLVAGVLHDDGSVDGFVLWDREECPTAVAGIGDVGLTFWYDELGLRAATVSTDGVIVHGSLAETGYPPYTVASPGTDAVLVVWQGPDALLGLRVEASGAPVGEVLTVDGAATYGTRAAVGWDGARWLVAWNGGPTTAVAREVWPDGTLGPIETLLDTGTGGPEPSVDGVAWSGETWKILVRIRQDTDPLTAHAVLLSRTSEAAPAILATHKNLYPTQPAHLACATSGCQVLVNERGHAGGPGTLVLHGDGFAPRVISLRANAQFEPALAAGADHALVAWVDDRATPRQLRAAFAGRDGAPLGDSWLLGDAGWGEARGARLADGWLLSAGAAIEDEEARIFRLDAAGTVRWTGVFAGDTQGPIEMTCRERTCLLWGDPAPKKSLQLYAEDEVTILDDGAVEIPVAAAVGDGFVVVGPLPETDMTILAAELRDADGARRGPPLLIEEGPAVKYAIASASGDGVAGYLVRRRTPGQSDDLVLYRLDAGGALPTPPVPIGAFEHRPAPSIAWDGTTWNVTLAHQLVRVDATGNIVETLALDETADTHALAAWPDGTLLVASDGEAGTDAMDTGIRRVVLRPLVEAPPPDAASPEAPLVAEAGGCGCNARCRARRGGSGPVGGAAAVTLLAFVVRRALRRRAA